MSDPRQPFDDDWMDRFLGARAPWGVRAVIARLERLGRAGGGRERDASASRDERIRRAVMERLPAGSPRLYRRLARLVVRAWSDATLRAELRRDPVGVLAASGIELPPGVNIRIVGPDGAEMPGPGELLLPLPEDPRLDESPSDSLATLEASVWAWMAGPSLDDAAAAPASTASGGHGAARTVGLAGSSESGAKARGRRTIPRWVAFAGAGAVTVAAVTVFATVALRGGAPQGSPISGSAGGVDGGLFWLLFGSIFVLVALAAWAASRRG